MVQITSPGVYINKKCTQKNSKDQTQKYQIYFERGVSAPTRGGLELQNFFFTSGELSEVIKNSLIVHHPKQGDRSFLYTDLATVMVDIAFKFDNIFMVRNHVKFHREVVTFWACFNS